MGLFYRDDESSVSMTAHKLVLVMASVLVTVTALFLCTHVAFAVLNGEGRYLYCFVYDFVYTFLYFCVYFFYVL